MADGASRMVAIASTGSQVQAEMWVEALRREGIPAVIRGRAAGAIPVDAGGSYVMVLEDDVGQALALLDEMGLEPGDRLL